MAFIKCSGGADKYKVFIGTIQLSTSGITTHNIGFRPDYLAVYLCIPSNSSPAFSCYNKDVSTTKAGRIASNSASYYNLGTTSLSSCINNISDTGFTMNKAYSSTYVNQMCYAIKEL